MNVNFGDYQYRTDQQVLFKHDELIPLKRNQAALLEFFLLDHESIHSKDDILDAVWQQQVVSEQVVFQTISQLRSVFGNDAIQTFSKKGYKWQIPVKPAEPVSDSISDPGAVPDSAPEVIVSQEPSKSTSPKTYWLAGTVSLFVVGLLISWYLVPNQSSSVDDSFSIYLVDVAREGQNSDNHKINRSLKTDGDFSLDTIQYQGTVSQLFATPNLVWTQQKLPSKSWMLWSETHKFNNGTLLHFGLSRGSLDWQGYLYAEDSQELSGQLLERLYQLDEMGLFSDSLDALDINVLSIMNKKYPNDPEILLKMVEHHKRTGLYDIAITYLQKLLNIKSSITVAHYKAHAHWHMGQIFKMRGQLLQANNSLNAMAEVLDATPLWPLRFHYLKTKAWLAYDMTDYKAMFNTLEQGIKEAEKAADPLTLFKMHILYSILAKNALDDERKYTHLNQAQGILLQHNLNKENLAVVYYLFAELNTDMEKAIPYYNEVLSLPRSQQNYWVQDQAFEKLAAYLISQEQFADAHLLLSDPKNNAKKLLLKGKLLLAEQKPVKARNILVKAFEQARLSFDNQSALKSALLLYHLSEDQPKAQAEYLAYLETNAKPDWIALHAIALNE